MKTRSTQKQSKNPILIICLIFMIGLTACDGQGASAPSPSPTSFAYQVRVQAKDTGTVLAGAQVRIEVDAQHAPLTEVTDVNGTARVFIESFREDKPARLIIAASGYKQYDQEIDLKKDILPHIIQLEAVHAQTGPILIPILGSTSTSTSPAPSPVFTNSPAAVAVSTTAPSSSSTACPWIPYLNGVPGSVLSSNNCLKDLRGGGMTGDEKQILFFGNGAPLGTYGVCRSISRNDSLSFHVSVQDDLIAARFLVTVGPEPVPDKKSSHAFRIQPQIAEHLEKEMWIKVIEYPSDNFPKDSHQIKAIPNWKYLKTWGFDFVFQFSGALVNASMNEPALVEQWSLSPVDRYLCLAYEAMPTALQSAQLEVRVSFP